MTTRSAVRLPAHERARRYKHVESLPDPTPREPFVANQYPHGMRANYMISWALRRRGKTFFVGGEGFLCIDSSVLSTRFVPDCIVAFDVDAEFILARNGYVINEVGKPPEFVMEIGSRTTGRVDVTRKREGYSRFGVLEYWRFDATGGDYHGQPLAGDTLVDGVYQPLPLHREPDGTVWGHSETLNLDIYWRDNEIYIYDPIAEEFFPGYEEAAAAMDERNAAIRERDAEIVRRIEAEAELERLRQRLRRVENSDSPE